MDNTIQTIRRGKRNVLLNAGHHYYRQLGYKNGQILWRCKNYAAEEIKCAGTIKLSESWIIMGCFLSLLGMQMIMLYPYSLLPGLRKPDSPFKVDSETESWLATSVTITFVIGSLLTSCLMDLLGRRLTHGLLILPAILSWLLTYFSPDVSTLMIARLIGGLGAGAPLVVGSAITGEYSSPEYRGFFSAIRSVSLCVASVSIHVMEQFFHWRTVALLSLTPLCIAMCMNFTWPESPMWLATTGKYKKSEEAFFWLRGKDENSVKEFEAMIDAQKIRAINAERTSLKNKCILFIKKFKKKTFIKPIFITCMSGILSEFCARNVFFAYAMDIIVGINIELKSYILFITVVIDILSLICSMFCGFLAKKLNRRTQLFWSGISSLIVLAIFCVYLFLESRDIIPKGRPWIPMSLLILYICLLSLGIVSINVTLYGEIFPLADKGTVTAVSVVLRNIPMVIIFKITPGLLSSIKVHGTFTVYGCVMAIALWFLYMTLPETTNRTLQEIEEFFIHGRFLDDGTCKVNDEETSEMLTPVNRKYLK